MDRSSLKRLISRLSLPYKFSIPGLVIMAIAFAASGSANLHLPGVVNISQQLSVGSTADPNSKAVIDSVSTTKGILDPRMTTTQRDAITSVPEALRIYNTSTHYPNFWNGSAWKQSVTSGDIVNADIASAAAIAYSKLALTGSIVDADVSGTAAIARGKIAAGTANRLVVENGSGILSDLGSLGTTTTLLHGNASGQPSFSAIVGADLPNPSSSSLGGIQSAAAVSHQWINSISTSGVPALSQPDFTDLSGTCTVAQGCTALTSGSLGDIIYGSAANVWSKLTGNITSTKKFLTQTGTGTVSAAPSWVQPACGDLSNAATSCSTDTTNASNITTGTLGATVQGNITSVGTISSGTWSGTTIAVNKGGTGQTSYTDGQILIGNSSGNTLTKATISAGTNITITNGNGSISIAASSSASPAYNYTSQTTTYNPASISDYIVASGASFSITLPTAVGQSGKSIVIEHAGTSITSVYTLNTTSSQTIGGVAGGSYALYTNGESLTIISDGSVWHILSHRTQTPGTSYSPTISNTSGNSATNSVWERDGRRIHIYGYVTIGTVSGISGVSLPTGVAIDATSTGINRNNLANGNATTGAGQLVGFWSSNSTNTVGYMVTATATSTSIVYMSGSFNSAGLSQTAGIQALVNGGLASWDFWVPVANWQP